MTLNWRKARTVKLTTTLIPNPASSGATMLRELNNVRVAYEGGLIHIDPRQDDATDGEYPVYAVPPTSVELITYIEAAPVAPFAFRG